MDKVIRDGRVAVLTSPYYGAGWYTWHGIKELIYDPKVVDMVERKVSAEQIVQYCEEKYTYTPSFTVAEDLVINWIVEGEKFIIEEFEGAESIKFKEDFHWITA